LILKKKPWFVGFKNKKTKASKVWILGFFYFVLPLIVFDKNDIQI